MFQFTPLLGAQSNSPASQSLLELDGGVKILVDVGWDDQFDPILLKSLESQLQSISIILLTHATSGHLAAFAHCCKHFPLFHQIPVYATAPVISLGRTLLQDIYASTPLAATVIPQSSLAETSYSYQSSLSDEELNILLQPPTPEEISKYFALVHPLKYSQPHQPISSPFSPPINDLTITAYNAGHSLGGTIWHIQHGMESIVYAVDWNQVRENVFAGAAWLGGMGGGGTEVIEQLRQPTALVCSARGAEKNTLTGGKKKRDDTLLDLIRSAIARGGTVLIPTDSSARVLELAYVLDHAWRRDPGDLADPNSLGKAKLYLASRCAVGTLRHVRSMLEWMDESVVKEFESEATASNSRHHRRNDSKQNPSAPNLSREQNAGITSSSPFELKYMKTIETRKKIEKVLAGEGPRVILASDSSLEWGFSTDVLQRIAGNSANLIILTEGSDANAEDSDRRASLSTVFRQWYREERDGSTIESASDGTSLEVRNTSNRPFSLSSLVREPLEGKELLIYQQYLASRRQSQNYGQAPNGTNLENSGDAVEEASSASSSSSEEDDPERQGKALNVSLKTTRFNRGKPEVGKEITGINIIARQPGVYDYDVRGKKGRDQMFPFLNKRHRADDFGELIRPEDYLRAEEREEVNDLTLNENGNDKKESFGQKRKWQDIKTRQDEKVNGGLPNKRRQSIRQSNFLREPRTNGMSNHSDAISSLDESEEDEADAASPGPSKLSTRKQSVMANFKIAHVDFSGLHDQRSLTMLIPLIRPKKLILIGGNLSETRYLANDCQQKLGVHAKDDAMETTSIIFTPATGQTVDASVDTNAWTVRLSENLVKRFHWQKVRSLGVATLMGLLSAALPVEATEESARRKKLKVSKSEEEIVEPNGLIAEHEEKPNLVPTLDVLPINMAAATRSVAQPLHVGDLRLADLRKVLQSSGHTAEFRGEGTLLIDDLVAVRKTGNGRIELETVSNERSDRKAQQLEGAFYAVKRKIYEGLAVIAGG